MHGFWSMLDEVWIGGGRGAVVGISGAIHEKVVASDILPDSLRDVNHCYSHTKLRRGSKSVKTVLSPVQLSPTNVYAQQYCRHRPPASFV